MRLEWVVLGVLAVWRVTHLLQAEDGPWGLSVRLRRAAGKGFAGKLLDCFYCLSLWVALPVVVLMEPSWREGVLLWLGLSGGASLLEQATAPVASFVEDPEKEGSHAVLRKDEAADVRSGEPPPG